LVEAHRRVEGRRLERYLRLSPRASASALQRRAELSSRRAHPLAERGRLDVRVYPPPKFEGRRRQALGAPATGQARQELPDLSLEPGEERHPGAGHLRYRPRSLRADGPRCPGQDQRPDRSDTVVPAVLPRRRVRLLRDEYRRGQHIGLSDSDGQPEERAEPDHTAAAHAGIEGSHPRLERTLCAVRADRALVANRSAAAGSRAAPITGRTRQAPRLVGGHSLLLLLNLVPELLVEPGPLSRPIDPAAVVPLACRQSRSTHRRAP